MEKKTKITVVVMVLIAVFENLILIDHFLRLDFSRPQRIERHILRCLSRQYHREFVIQQIHCDADSCDGYAAEEAYPDYPIYFSYPDFFYRDYFFAYKGTLGNVYSVRVGRVFDAELKKQEWLAIEPASVNLQWDLSILSMLESLDRDPTIEELGEIPFTVVIHTLDGKEFPADRQFPCIDLWMEENQREILAAQLREQFPDWTIQIVQSSETLD